MSGEMEAVFPDVQVGLVVIFDYVCVNMKKKYVWNKLNNQNSGKTFFEHIEGAQRNYFKRYKQQHLDISLTSS